MIFVVVITEACGEGVDHYTIFPGQTERVLAHVPVSTSVNQELTVQEVILEDGIDIGVSFHQ